MKHFYSIAKVSNCDQTSSDTTVIIIMVNDLVSQQEESP